MSVFAQPSVCGNVRSPVTTRTNVCFALHAAAQYEDVMSWIRALCSRRELVFSLVERTDGDDCDDFTVAVIDDSARPVMNSAIHHAPTQRRRNASLKVYTVLTLILVYIISFISGINSKCK